MTEEHTHWNMQSAIEQLESCEYDCIGGPLVNNAAFVWLKQQVKDGPKFAMGQTVYRRVFAEVEGAKMESWASYVVVGCRMGSDTKGVTWSYLISRDPPAAWHYGNVHATDVSEGDLFDALPEAIAQSEVTGNDQ